MDKQETKYYVVDIEGAGDEFIGATKAVLEAESEADALARGKHILSHFSPNKDSFDQWTLKVLGEAPASEIAYALMREQFYTLTSDYYDNYQPEEGTTDAS